MNKLYADQTKTCVLYSEKTTPIYTEDFIVYR